MDASLLMPRDKVIEKYKEIGRGPYTFEIDNGQQALFYFGGNHSRDPQNEQYLKLREYWQKFLSKTEGKPRIVLVEKELRRVGSDENTTIQNGSEGSLVSLWAGQKEIPLACPEPNLSEVYSRTVTEFSLDLVAYYEFSVAHSNWLRYPEPRDGQQAFVNFIERFFDWIKTKPEWTDYDWSLDKMKNMHRELFKEEFDENRRNNYINPNLDETIINKIARFESDIRDIHIVSEIQKYWKEGKNILVVFGSGHAIIQEPALRELLQ